MCASSIMLSSIRRKIITPIWAIKNKSPILIHQKYLEHSQYFSESRLKEIQWKKVRSIINYAYYNNSYYNEVFKNIGFDPEDLKTPENIRELPLLTKTDIRNNRKKLLSKGYRTSNLYHAKTGGSTGRPIEILRTVRCMELKKACTLRHNRWVGWELGETVGAVWGNPTREKTLNARIKSALLGPVLYLDTMSLNEESVLTFAKMWLKRKPTLLYGHAHSLFLLAKIVSSLCIAEIRPKGIISTSMTLLPHERSEIERVFGEIVFDRYGCEEVSLIASECEKHEGMHLNVDHLYIEFLKEDGTYAQDGENGAIVVTDLLSKAMPLIRYRVEDVGIPLSRKCSCGRGLPLMENLSGRMADFLSKKDGTLVAGLSLIERTLTAIPGIDQMQIIQESLSKFVLNIVRDAEFSEETQKKLSYELTNVFGHDISISINFLARIFPEKSGKYRFSISKVSNPYLELR